MTTPALSAAPGDAGAPAAGARYRPAAALLGADDPAPRLGCRPSVKLDRA